MTGGKSILQAIMPQDAQGWRLDRALAVVIPTLSRERLKALISSGQVSNEGGALARDPAMKVMPGARFTVVVPDPTPAHNEAQDIPLAIAYEDEHLIVVDKPPGLVVHPAAGNFDGTLVNALLHHCRGSLSGIGGVERPGIVHRIDKDTSGLMIAAKTDPAHERIVDRHTQDTSLGGRADLDEATAGCAFDFQLVQPGLCLFHLRLDRLRGILRGGDHFLEAFHDARLRGSGAL